LNDLERKEGRKEGGREGGREGGPESYVYNDEDDMNLKGGDREEKEIDLYMSVCVC
jgi:hypothetical protein